MSWPTYALDELGTVSRGRSRHRPRDAEHLYGGPFPFIQTGDVKAAPMYLNSFSQTYSEAGLAQSKMWPKGTLCITIAANIAETCILDIEACFPDSIIGFVADAEKADTKFIKYQFDAIMREQMRRVSQGAAQDNLSQSKLLSFRFPVPDLPTQERIAGVLSAYDDLIENNRRRIALLEQAARLLYREWFVHFRFPGSETTKFVDGLPEGWKVRKVKGLIARLKSKPKVRKDEYQEYGQWPCVDQGQDFIGGYTDNKEAIYHGSLPLIVFGDHTRALKFVDFPFARGADGTQIIQSNEERLPQELFYFSLINVDLSNYAYARHFKFLKDQDIIIPTEELGKSFSERAKAVFDQVRRLRDQNRKLAKARDLLLPRLMDGRLPIPE